MTTDAPLLTPDLPTEVTTSTTGTRTTVHLLRHGEVHNPGGVLYGRLPSFRLSEDGLKMAHDAAEALRGRDITVVVASPLQRAQETAAADRRAVRPRHPHRRAADRERERLRGQDRRRRRRGAEQPGELEALHATRSGRAGASRTSRSRSACSPRRRRPATSPAGTRRCASATSCRSGRVRRYVEGRKMWHRPDRRQCGLASLTSLTWVDDRLLTVTYSEPAGAVSRRPGAGA